MFISQLHVLNNPLSWFFSFYQALKLKTTLGAGQGEEIGTTACHSVCLLWEFLQPSIQPGATFPLGTAQVYRNKIHSWQCGSCPDLKLHAW